MRPSLAAMLAASLLFLPAPARADEPGPSAVLDKAITALGGEEALKKAESFAWKSKGTLTLNGNDNAFTIKATVQGLDHLRSEFEAEFGGNPFKAATVLAGAKGWRKFGEDVMELEGDALTNEKRTIYLSVGPVTILPLKGKGFKVESAGEEKVGDKPAAVLKVTGPDGKDFKLWFDKESGLPVREVARVLDFQGEEFTQETSYAAYKEFDGIKKATKVVSKRDGEPFISQEIVEFKVVTKADPATFTEPK